MKKAILFLSLVLLCRPLWAADTKISALTADSSPGADSLFVTIDDPGGTPVSRKSTVAEVLVDSNIPNDITIDLATTATTANAGDSATAFFSSGTIEHERGGLEAAVNAYSGLVAISGGSTSEVDAKSELEAQIADVNDFGEADGDTYTGTHNFGGADDLEIPNATSDVVVDTEGQIALDSGDTHLAVYSQGAEWAVPLVQQKDFHIIEPDQVATVDSNVFLFEVNAPTYPNGITITKITMASSANGPVSGFEEWSSPTSSVDTIDTVDMTGVQEKTETDITNPAVSAGSYVVCDVADSNVDWVRGTIYFRVEED